MAICTYCTELESTIYEKDVYQKTINAMTVIVEKHNDIDFWLLSKGLFSAVFFNAAWEMKYRFPQKNITITYVTTNESIEDVALRLEEYKLWIQPSVIDRIIFPPENIISPAQQNLSVRRKRRAQWIIESADSIITYLYPDFHEDELVDLELAKRKGKEIYDVTDEETKQYIEKRISERLTDEEQAILKGLKDGLTQKQLSATLGLSAFKVKNALSKSRRRLKDASFFRFCNQLKSNEWMPAVCSVFALGEANYQNLKAFSNAVRFLRDFCGVVQYRILCEYCDTGYMAILDALSELNPSIQVVAITHVPEFEALTRDEWRSIASPYCPPCHAVDNIDTHTSDESSQVITAVEELINKTDYCICFLDDNPLKDYILKCVTGPDKAKLVDVSKKYVAPFGEKRNTEPKNSI